jgi:hypothetical protein
MLSRRAWAYEIHCQHWGEKTTPTGRAGKSGDQTAIQSDLRVRE